MCHAFRAHAIRSSRAAKPVRVSVGRGAALASMNMWLHALAEEIVDHDGEDFEILDLL
jgi:hypothetical protein